MEVVDPNKRGAQEFDPMSASVPRAGTVTPIEPIENTNVNCDGSPAMAEALIT
jgi:hypothetical protein